MLSIDEFPDVSTFHPFESYRFKKYGAYKIAFVSIGNWTLCFNIFVCIFLHKHMPVISDERHIDFEESRKYSVFYINIRGQIARFL
jgi:hypothetical protein